MRKKIISARKFVKPSFAALIEKKRSGGELSDEEIRYVVDSILDKEMPEFQMAALAMAVYFQGMSAQETATFAEEMMLSGEDIDLTEISRPKIDKYSTGGVGDKRNPPVYMVPGDIVEVDIGLLGVLKNPVIAAPKL